MTLRVFREEVEGTMIENSVNYLRNMIFRQIDQLERDAAPLIQHKVSKEIRGGGIIEYTLETIDNSKMVSEHSPIDKPSFLLLTSLLYIPNFEYRIGIELEDNSHDDRHKVSIMVSVHPDELGDDRILVLNLEHGISEYFRRQYIPLPTFKKGEPAMFKDILDLVTNTEVKKDGELSVNFNIYPDNTVSRIDEIKLVKDNFEVCITVETLHFSFFRKYHIRYVRDGEILFNRSFNNTSDEEAKELKSIVRILLNEYNDFVKSEKNKSLDVEKDQVPQFNYTEDYRLKINKKVGIRNLKLGLLEQGEDSIRVYLFNKVKTLLYNIINPSFSNLDNGEKVINDKVCSIKYIKKDHTFDGEILYLETSYSEIEELENKKITHHNRFNMAITDAELIEDIEESISNAVKRAV